MAKKESKNFVHIIFDDSIIADVFLIYTRTLATTFQFAFSTWSCSLHASHVKHSNVLSTNNDDDEDNRRKNLQTISMRPSPSTEEKFGASADISHRYNPPDLRFNFFSRTLTSFDACSCK